MGRAVCMIAVLFVGCAPRLRCREASPLSTRETIEICERRECRNLATGKFVECPADGGRSMSYSATFEGEKTPAVKVKCP